MWRTSETKLLLFELWTPGTEIIVFDTETTGFSPVKNHIIQIAANKLRIKDDLTIEKIDSLNEYINPGYTLPPKIVELTGITNDFICEQKTEDEVFDKVFSFFGEEPIVAGYNGGFDERFFAAMYERHGKVFKPKASLDVLKMARDLIEYNQKENRKLCTVAEMYGADRGLSFHNAMDDTIATGRLLYIFYNEYLKNDAEREKLISSTPKQVPVVKKLTYWELHQIRRIYIDTTLGTFFYDIRKKAWDKKKDNLVDMELIDMEALRKSAFEYAKVTCEEELARYRG